MFQTAAFPRKTFVSRRLLRKANMRVSLSLAETDFRKLMSFFLISGWTSVNK